MELTDFLDNLNQIKACLAWFEKPKKPYLIISGQHGYGKTTLATLIANEFYCKIQKITPDDDINHALKSLNTQSLEDACEEKETKKVILIDDLEDFDNKKSLYDIHEFCCYPVIYTITDKSKMSNDFKNKGLVITLERPRDSQIIKYLRKKVEELSLDISDDIVTKVAIESPTVRSAVNSLYYGFSREFFLQESSIWGLIKQLKRRELTKDIHRGHIKAMSGYIKCYDSPSCKLRTLLAEYDFNCRTKFIEPVDAYLLNNMKEPIEQVTFEYKNNKNKFIKPKKPVTSKPEKKIDAKVKPLESFF